MGKLILDGCANANDTLVSNSFIDDYMPKANGEYVKIYLYLLRALTGGCKDLSVCHIADIFDHTEKDVIRALKYWEQAGLLKLSFDNNKILTNISVNPVREFTASLGNQMESIDFQTTDPTASVFSANDGNSAKFSPEFSKTGISEGPAMNSLADNNLGTGNASIDSAVESKANSGSSIGSDINNDSPSVSKAVTSNSERAASKRTYTTDEINIFRTNEEFEELIFFAYKYLGKTLGKADINSLLFIYDELGFNADLIEYLLEYCVTSATEKGKRATMRYIEKVAIDWDEQGICTAEAAKKYTDTFANSCYPVLKAFGLTGRDPSKGEKEFIVKWTTSYGFNMDIILEACNKTMDSIHKPSFPYTDSILNDWKKKGVHRLNDIKTIDSEHKAKIAANNMEVSSLSNDKFSQKGASASGTSASSNAGKFSDFNHRTYDYDDLEKKLLNKA